MLVLDVYVAMLAEMIKFMLPGRSVPRDAAQAISIPARIIANPLSGNPCWPKPVRACYYITSDSQSIHAGSGASNCQSTHAC